MTNAEEEKRGEVRVVFLGPVHKATLFDKLCQAAEKFEKHVHYDDTFYLTVRNASDERIIQFTDPGLARTGGREMAIRCADVAVLVYSAGSASSLQQLKSLKEDFDRRKHLPIRLICDLDENYDEEDDTNSTGISSTSEGYESDTDREIRLRRRPSMEKIRRAQEDFPAAEDAGKQLAAEFGEHCVYMQINSSTYTEADVLLRDLLEAAKSRKKIRSRSLLPRLKSNNKSKESSPVSSMKESSSSTNGSGEESPKRKNSDVKDSKVCSIM